jgi:WhiB family transcriptional regulator, redox-sensing transcriptional regulator
MRDNTAGAAMPARLHSAVLVTNALPDPWTRQAICQGEDPEVFFPSHGDPATEARQICLNCSVRPECLEYAITADEWGIWGGLDRDQRRAIASHLASAANRAGENEASA